MAYSKAKLKISGDRASTTGSKRLQPEFFNFFISISFLFAICNNTLSKWEEKNGGL
jgi:hypothetical protein